MALRLEEKNIAVVREVHVDEALKTGSCYSGEGISVDLVKGLG